MQIKQADEYIVFSADLLCNYGGVSDYTDNLANQLQKKNRLAYALSFHGPINGARYEIKKFNYHQHRKPSIFDRFFVTRKIATAFYFARLYRDAKRELKKIGGKNVTVVFTDYYTTAFDIIIHFARKFNLRYGIVFHGLDLLTAQQKKFLHFRDNVSSASFLVFNSKATVGLYNKMYGDFEVKKSAIVYPGIDVERINSEYLQHKSAVSYRQAEEIIFTTVCYFTKRKGVDIGIRIVAEVYKQFPNIKYYIVGQGPEEENLKQLVKQLNAESYIHFLGAIDNREKYSLLTESDIFLLPNHSAGNTDVEGFGISFIEASLCDNVVIGGNHGGAVEAVNNGVSGFLYDFDNEDSVQLCVAQICDCIRDQVKMQQIKAGGKKFVEDNYDWEILINKFLALEN